MKKINELLNGTPHEELRIEFCQAMNEIKAAGFEIDFTKIEKESRMPNSDKIETEFEGCLPSGESIEVTLSMDGMFGEGYCTILRGGRVVAQKRAKKADKLPTMIKASIRAITEMATA